ncbi:hypothetical protein DRO61_11975, partial [Candidatus Bathyarchaeota archaeon]
MTNNELKVLLQSNFKLNPTNFAEVEDTKEATRKALIEFYQLKDLTPREIKANKPYIMALIEEVIDEILPEQLQEKVSEFAEVKSYARDAEVVFHIKGIGKRRAFLTIKKGQRGGMYQAARLDDRSMSLPVWTETVGVYITLEEILLGKYSLQELMNNIVDGFIEKMYQLVVEALQAAQASVPAANKATGAGFVKASVDPIIRVIAAYGKPVIMGFHDVVSKIDNSQFIGSSNPNTPESDLDELKETGFIGKYKGVPVVKMPNYIIDEVTNATWLLDESFLFILPTGTKPVKVALKGDLTIIDNRHPSGSEEWNAHKMIGVGILLYNNIGIYE